MGCLSRIGILDSLQLGGPAKLCFCCVVSNFFSLQDFHTFLQQATLTFSSLYLVVEELLVMDPMWSVNHKATLY